MPKKTKPNSKAKPRPTPKPQSETSAKTTLVARRRTIAVIAASAIAIVGIVVIGRSALSPQTYAMGEYPANSGYLGDVDGDGTLSHDEADDLKTTQNAFEVISEAALPQLDNTAGAAAPGDEGGEKTAGTAAFRMVTPGGEEWWPMVTSLTAQLRAWEVPAPEAEWYAAAELRASQATYKRSGAKKATYPVVLVWFDPDSADYTGWAAQAAEVEQISFRPIDMGGGLVMLAPSWVDVSKEPLVPMAAPSAPAQGVEEYDPNGGQKVAKNLGVDVPVAMWEIDWTEWIDSAARNSAVPSAYREYWRNLGFEVDPTKEHTTWSATTADPSLAFRGRVENFHPSKVDVVTASSIFETLPCTTTNEDGAEVPVFEGTGPDGRNCARAFAMRTAGGLTLATDSVNNRVEREWGTPMPVPSSLANPSGIPSAPAGDTGEIEKFVDEIFAANNGRALSEKSSVLLVQTLDFEVAVDGWNTRLSAPYLHRMMWADRDGEWLNLRLIRE